MLPRIKIIRPMEEFSLYVEFDDGKIVLYDMNEDIDLASDIIYAHGKTL